MDQRARLAGVLHELRALGVGELFLDGLTAEEALGLVRDRGDRVDPRAAPAMRAARKTEVARRAGSGAGAPTVPRPFPGPPSAGASSDNPPFRILAAEASGCTRCGLAATRTQVVFGRGDPTADLVVVGEAPGGEEDRQGLPFVGPAGKLLDLMLQSTGFARDSVYICNVIKCRPPNNRDPRAEEVVACSEWLHRQLELIRPKVLLAVGKFAGQMLSGSEASISKLRGVVHSYRGIPVVATYHPAYLLRTPGATRGTWQDFQLMRRVLDEHD